MLLGALVGTGIEVELIQAAIDAVSPEPITLRVEQVSRGGLLATRCHVEVADSASSRSWTDVRRLLETAALGEEVRGLALAAFERLARAEGAVHGVEPAEVHFHEVGALDAIADVVGVCAGFVALGADDVTVSQVAVGHGSVRGAHGVLPIPPPAVAQLLLGAPSYAGPPGAPPMELCTPTGAALLSTIAAAWGPQPAQVTTTIGVGAGSRDPDTHANVVRLLVGAPAPAASLQTTPEVMLETNVDDLDPRVWPAVLAALFDAGAADAWLTPILMKKGRPAHALSVLVAPAHLAAVREAIFRHTSTIGLRATEVTKDPLERETAQVEVGGHPIAVKLARLRGLVVNAQPEYDDVAAVAAALGRPVVDVLAEASAAARRLLP